MGCPERQGIIDDAEFQAMKARLQAGRPRQSSQRRRGEDGWNVRSDDEGGAQASAAWPLLEGPLLQPLEQRLLRDADQGASARAS